MQPETKLAIRKIIENVIDELVRKKVMPQGVKYKWAGQPVVLLTGAGDLEKRFGKQIAYLCLGTISKHKLQDRLNTILSGYMHEMSAQRLNVYLSQPMMNYLNSQTQIPIKDARLENLARNTSNVYQYGSFLRDELEDASNWREDFLKVKELTTPPVTPQSMGVKLNSKNRSMFTHFGPMNSLESAADMYNIINTDGPAYEGIVETYQGNYYVRNLNYKPV